MGHAVIALTCCASALIADLDTYAARSRWLRWPETDRTGGQDPRRTDERPSSAEVSASVRHRIRVRSSLANFDFAEMAGAVLFTNKCGRSI